jgi:hypothetical protein
MHGEQASDKSIVRISVVRVVWKSREAAAGFNHSWKVTDVTSIDGRTVICGSGFGRIRTGRVVGESTRISAHCVAYGSE